MTFDPAEGWVETESSCPEEIKKKKEKEKNSRLFTNWDVFIKKPSPVISELAIVQDRPRSNEEGEPGLYNPRPSFSLFVRAGKESLETVNRARLHR